MSQIVSVPRWIPWSIDPCIVVSLSELLAARCYRCGVRFADLAEPHKQVAVTGRGLRCRRTNEAICEGRRRGK